MSFTDTDQFKELVRSRTDILSLISESVGLQSQRGGHEFVGLCPFHDDHRPSMRVNADRQSFKCWACGTGGDCFEFVMQRDRLTFPETLELLAHRAGLEMPKRTVAGNDTGVTRQRLHEVLGWAESEFHRCLVHDPIAEVARQYLASRGFATDTIQQFRMGYHPNDWQWLIDRSRGKFKIEELDGARLVGEKEGTGRYYDYFVDRVMFPIRDMQGRTVAFGGRILPQEGGSERAKYWNSPESSIFSKSHLLYGLEMARDGFKRTQTAVVVEGYTDCILAHQAGMTNVVGTLGTALTDEHVSVLKRFVRKVVLIYDGDEAGQKASVRSLPRFLSQEVDLRILTLPDNLDPADALQLHGREWFENLVSHSVEVWEYKLRRLVGEHGLGSIDACQRVLEEMLQVIALVPARMGNGLSGSWRLREDLILGKLSQKLGVAERTIRDRLAELRKNSVNGGEKGRLTRVDPAQENRSNRYSRLLRSPSCQERLECDLLALILSHPHTVERFCTEVRVEQIGHAELARLLHLIYNLYESGIEPGFEQVLLELEASELKPLVVSLMDYAQRSGLREGLADQLLAVFQRNQELGPSEPEQVVSEKFTNVLDQVELDPFQNLRSGNDSIPVLGTTESGTTESGNTRVGFSEERVEGQGGVELDSDRKRALQRASELAAARDQARRDLRTTWNQVTR